LGVSVADEAKEILGLGGVQRHVSELLTDEKLDSGVCVEDAGVGVVGAGGVKLVEEVGGLGVEDGVSVEAGGVSESLGDVSFAGAASADAEDGASLLNPAAVQEFLDGRGSEFGP